MSEQHYQIPSLDKEKNTKELDVLKIGDRLVYAWMKTHMNYETKQCFPSYIEIANEINEHSLMEKGSSPCTESFVKAAIRRLESIKWIKVTRNIGSSNTYHFLQYERFEKFYRKFLENKSLTWKEKDFYIQLQQYIFITEDEAYFMWDYGKIAAILHLSYPTVKKYITSLKNKQVFIKTITTMRDQETHLPIIKTTVDLQLIGQENLVKQIIKNAVDIQETKDDVAELREKVELLTEKIEQLIRKGIRD